MCPSAAELETATKIKERTRMGNLCLHAPGFEIHVFLFIISARVSILLVDHQLRLTFYRPDSAFQAGVFSVLSRETRSYL